jgi:hypothetical protein
MPRLRLSTLATPALFFLLQCPLALAQADPNSQPAAPAYQYSRPFVQPLSVWDYWWLLLLPLALGISIVYKSVKCSHIREVPKAALGMTFWILLAFSAAAFGLLGLVRVME